jgi:hypothetical protein
LQPGADLVREHRPLTVEAAEEVQHEVADRVRGVAAVAEELVERRVPLDVLVLFERD